MEVSLNHTFLLSVLLPIQITKSEDNVGNKMKAFFRLAKNIKFYI